MKPLKSYLWVTFKWLKGNLWRVPLLRFPFSGPVNVNNISRRLRFACSGHAHRLLQKLLNMPVRERTASPPPHCHGHGDAWRRGRLAAWREKSRGRKGEKIASRNSEQ